MMFRIFCIILLAFGTKVSALNKVEKGRQFYCSFITGIEINLNSGSINEVEAEDLVYRQITTNYKSYLIFSTIGKTKLQMVEQIFPPDKAVQVFDLGRTYKYMDRYWAPTHIYELKLVSDTIANPKYAFQITKDYDNVITKLEFDCVLDKDTSTIHSP